MSTPRGPDYDLVIARSFIGFDGSEKNKYFKVGSAWQNENGMNIECIFLPGVKLRLYPVDEQKGAKNANSNKRKPRSAQKNTQRSKANTSNSGEGFPGDESIPVNHVKDDKPF